MGFTGTGSSAARIGSSAASLGSGTRMKTSPIKVPKQTLKVPKAPKMPKIPVFKAPTVKYQGKGTRARLNTAAEKHMFNSKFS